jgi:hypothetical protein
MGEMSRKLGWMPNCLIRLVGASDHDRVRGDGFSKTKSSIFHSKKIGKF